jgi:hypothetical protein
LSISEPVGARRNECIISGRNTVFPCAANLFSWKEEECIFCGSLEEEDSARENVAEPTIEKNLVFMFLNQKSHLAYQQR